METLKKINSEIEENSEKRKAKSETSFTFQWLPISSFRHFAISPFRHFAISLFILLSTSSYAQLSNSALQEGFSKSYSFESRGNFADAITSMKAIYQEDSYEINLRLGWVTYLAGQFTESSAYYQKAIKLKPYSIEAKIGFANPASALGNWDQVISEYNAVLAIDPQNTLVNYRMGSIFYGRKDYAKAEKYLEKVVNLYPFDFDAMILYAWTNFKLGKLREAQVLFNKALLMRPKDAGALEGLGLIK